MTQQRRYELNVIVESGHHCFVPIPIKSKEFDDIKHVREWVHMMYVNLDTDIDLGRVINGEINGIEFNNCGDWTMLELIDRGCT